MRLKKSAVILIVLTVSCIGLVVFSSAIAPAAPIAAPVKCESFRRCSQLNEMKSFAPWDMVSQILLRSAA